MLRMSCCDHFSSHPRFINIFKRLLLWSRWANFAQISYGASRGNESLLKWSPSVDQDGCHAIYGKNLSKSSSPEPRMPWGWIFAQIIRDRRSTKVAQRIVVHWCLTFLRQGHSLPYAYVWAPYVWIEKLLRISNNFSSEASEPVLL